MSYDIRYRKRIYETMLLLGTNTFGMVVHWSRQLALATVVHDVR